MRRLVLTLLCVSFIACTSGTDETKRPRESTAPGERPGPFLRDGFGTPELPPNTGPTPPGTESGTLRISVSCRDVWIKPGASADVQVFLTRTGESASRIELNAVNLPDGITAEPVLVEAHESVATVVLHATSDAPVGATRYPARIYAYRPGGTFAAAYIPTVVSNDPPAWVTTTAVSSSGDDIDEAFGVRASDWRMWESTPLAGGDVAVRMVQGVVMGEEARRCTNVVRLGPDGNPVSSYGERGAFVMDMPGTTFMWSLGFTADGAALFTGGNHVHEDEPTTMLVGRVSADGQWDRSFGVDGILRRTRVERVAVMDSGEFILAGAEGGSVIVRRFLADGTPDVSFGDDGSTTTSREGWSRLQAASITLDRDGKILVAVPGMLLRYDALGTLDPTFGNGGILDARLFGDFTIDEAGRIYVVAWISYGVSELRRLLPDGSLDPTFGVDGRATPEPRGYLYVEMHAGRLLVAGGISDPWGWRPYVMRLLENGDVDPSFGAGGRREIDLGMRVGIADVSVSGDRIFLSGTLAPGTGGPPTWGGYVLALRP